MRKTILLLFAGCLVLGGGCGKKIKEPSAISHQPSAVENGVEPSAVSQKPVASGQTSDLRPQGIDENPKVSDGNFPQIMVGVWEARPAEYPGQRMVIKLDSDGSITKMEHLLGGRIVVAEGGRWDLGPDPNTSCAFILGPCTSKFNQQTEILDLEINIDYFEMILPQGTLSGKTKYTFSGKVSRDGQTWEADWRDYTWLDGAQQLDTKEIDKNPRKITFRKWTEKDFLMDANSATNN